MKDLVLTADIGGTTVKNGLFDAGGNLLEKWEVNSRTDSNGAYIIPDIASSMESHLSAAGKTFEDVIGIGIDAPGAVIHDTLVLRCVNIGWKNVDVAEGFTKRTGVTNVKAANDANAAALGELVFGSAKGHSSAVLITLGTGIGGGVIVDRKIVSGAFGSAGEVGHIHLKDGETTPCGCGRFGCYEQYGSARGIARMAREYLDSDSTPSVLRNRKEVTAKDVFDAARENDPLALRIVDDSTRIIAELCACIAGVVDPEIFIIGGGVSKAGRTLLDPLVRHYRSIVFQGSRDTEFTIATLENDAGMYGLFSLICP